MFDSPSRSLTINNGVVLRPMNTHTPRRLSAGAVKELREIYEDEFDDVLTDFEIEDMGVRLLSLFDILLNTPGPVKIELTRQEQLALDYIHAETAAGGTPTVRGMAQAAGLRSSRSGMRLRDTLIAKGIL
jgi:hypothetical protein